ncbi:MAG: helix-turn-helix domain-containing protein [Deltaproteobacteria bacterium]|nr:helix-turn-helix domain-containing protein [Deltaproteobacteria bacterium]
MIKKKVLNLKRVRKINGGFSFIPHRFVLDGFLAALGQKELLLYLFLVLVSDRNGLSFYSYDTICTLLEISLDEYIASRNSLMDKDLIAFDGTLFQVLDLPGKLPDRQEREVRSSVETLIQQTVKGF